MSRPSKSPFRRMQVTASLAPNIQNLSRAPQRGKPLTLAFAPQHYNLCG